MRKKKKIEPFEVIPLELPKEVERITLLPINHPERVRVLKKIMEEEERASRSQNPLK